MLSIAAASGAAVKFHEEGNYTCVASSPHGSYSKVFNVMFRGGTWVKYYNEYSSFRSWPAIYSGVDNISRMGQASCIISLNMKCTADLWKVRNSTDATL